MAGVNHSNSRATYEFRLLLVVLVAMIAIAVIVMQHTTTSFSNKVQCITSPGAQVCGTSVTRPQ